MTEYIEESLNKDLNMKPRSKEELKSFIDNLIKKRGLNANLNDIDTSEIEDMSFLFYGSKFNGDISRWNVSEVTDISCMFAFSEFNQDISRWDVGKFTDMTGMLIECPLEKNPPKWYTKWRDENIKPDDSIKAEYQGIYSEIYNA